MIRIGVLGTANIATKSIIPAILELNMDFQLVGVASRSQDKADELAQLYQLEPFVGYESILDKSLIDAVYIPLPNSLHYEWVKKSLDVGLNVLVEKSLANTYEEVVELCKIAKGRKLALIENFQFRFHPQFKFILKCISDDVIGDLRYIKSSFEFPPFSGMNNIRYQKELGGGALLDAGAYPLKVINLILGYDTSVVSAFVSIDQNLDVDIYGGGMVLNTATDTFGFMSFGFDNYYQCSLEIHGSKGVIKSDRIFTAPPDYKPVISIKVSGNPDRSVEVEEGNHFKQMLAYFCKVIKDKTMQEGEITQNLTQARLLKEFKLKSNG